MWEVINGAQSSVTVLRTPVFTVRQGLFSIVLSVYNNVNIPGLFHLSNTIILMYRVSKVVHPWLL